MYPKCHQQTNYKTAQTSWKCMKNSGSTSWSKTEPGIPTALRRSGLASPQPLWCCAASDPFVPLGEDDFFGKDGKTTSQKTNCPFNLVDFPTISHPFCQNSGYNWWILIFSGFQALSLGAAGGLLWQLPQGWIKLFATGAWCNVIWNDVHRKSVTYWI